MTYKVPSFLMMIVHNIICILTINLQTTNRPGMVGEEQSVKTEWSVRIGTPRPSYIQIEPDYAS